MTATRIARGLCQCGCGQPAPIATCSNAKRGYVKGQPKRFVALHQARCAPRGTQSFRWKGGRQTIRNGYVKVYVPSHPRAHNGYVLEHLLVAESALGRPIPVGVEVHHVNEVTSDNRPENLVICQDLAYHKLLHQRMRALEACGDPAARRCVYCKGYDRQDNITVTTGNRAYHRTCAAAATRKPRRVSR